MAWTTPATVAVGDPAVSSWANTYVRDNAAFLYGDTGWLVPSPTSFANGWSSAGDLRFARLGRLCKIEGSITGGTPDVVAFTLPGGYCPPSDRRFAVIDYATGFAVQAYVQPSGDVTPIGSSPGQNIVLDGVTFALV